MSYYELRLSKSAMECVINALHVEYSLAVRQEDLDKADVYANLEAYFKSKLDDTYAVYE